MSAVEEADVAVDTPSGAIFARDPANVVVQKAEIVVYIVHVGFLKLLKIHAVTEGKRLPEVLLEHGILGEVVDELLDDRRMTRRHD